MCDHVQHSPPHVRASNMQSYGTRPQPAHRADTHSSTIYGKTIEEKSFTQHAVNIQLRGVEIHH